MNSTATPLVLAGSQPDTGPLRICQRHGGEPVPPGGGIQISPKKWICSSCWKGGLTSQRMTEQNINKGGRNHVRST